MFNLGTITITGSQPGSTVSPTGVTVSSEQLYVRNAVTLDDALANIPGVNATMDSNARRNERDIFVRGFGRWQVPLTVDGVRVYLPADNRLDYNRLITPDLAEIQVEKGYASVLNGPGGMGGWINLVTRKPTKPFEGEVTAGMNLDNRGNFNGWQTYARLGTLQERYYLQGSIAVVDQDYWTLSRKYQPVPGSLEDGGRRINSDSSDWRANFKLGFTPNDTDEYVFNYIKQEGEKGAPLHVRNNPPVPANGFWRWPYWNIQNVSFHSNTKIGEVSYVKTKLYYNTFDNLLSAYDNITYTTQSANGRFDSSLPSLQETTTQNPFAQPVISCYTYRYWLREWFPSAGRYPEHRLARAVSDLRIFHFAEAISSWTKARRRPACRMQAACFRSRTRPWFQAA